MSDSTPQAASVPSVPRHVAIIMDGNNRWAKKRGLRSSSGHRAGVEAIRPVLRVCRDSGVEVVTVFAFSSENWQRPSMEVRALMRLFSHYLDSEVQQLHKDGVRVRFMGQREQLSAALQERMARSEALTRNNTNTQLVIAVDYGGQWDIVHAARQLAAQVQRGELTAEQIDIPRFSEALSLSDLPNPDLCIRTAGEQRISNFMLWQLAYSELYFSPCLWPDFGEAEMTAALQDYAQRDRRFGSRRDTGQPEK